MQRLADGADCQGEIVHRLVLRHIADIEMALGHQPVVAGDKAVEDVGQEAPLLAVDAAHDAEIHRHDIPGFRIGEQVARMHVGMEKAVADGVPEETL